VDDVRRERHPLVTYSGQRAKTNRELRDYLYENLYYNPEVFEPNRRAVRLLQELFEYYFHNSSKLDSHVRKRIRKEGLSRAICDYLAGMTDRYAMQEYQRLFGLKV
jgi:dGTPase